MLATLVRRLHPVSESDTLGNTSADMFSILIIFQQFVDVMHIYASDTIDK